MNVALDTNAYTALVKGDAATRVVVERADSIALPFVVVGELRAGFVSGRRATENERTLRQFLMKPRVSVVFADDQTTQNYAALFRQLRTQGTPIPTNDIWIAALVVQHGLTLHAHDKHFDHLPQLARI